MTPAARSLPLAFALVLPLVARAAPQAYEIDPAHTYPSFEADHLGISVWRGKFKRTAGSVTLDRAAGSGVVKLTVDIGSIDFGLDKMNEAARSAELFDAAAYPEAVYSGRLEAFVDGAPTRLAGELRLRGVTRPLALEIKRFRCKPHPLFKRELCGADAYGSFQRDDFGMTAGKDYGFDMTVQLRIQVEALAAE